MRGRGRQLLRCLGLVMGLLCMLVGCGGNSGGGDTSGTVARGRPLALQLQLSSELAPQAASTARTQGLVAAEVRQVQPGDPGFIERLEIRLQAQGSDLVPPQVFTLDSTEQDTATRDVTVPDTAPATLQVLVSAFNPQGIEVFRGNTSVGRDQTSAVVTLLRAALVPVPATPANLQQTTFNFTDGAIFGLVNIPLTLATGTFVGSEGDFALTANGSVASGNLVIGSCTFVVTTSTFPAGQGLQVGDRLVLDPCQIDAIDRRLIVTNAIVSSTPTISSLPVVIPPDTTLNLPPPPPLVIDEDTSGSLQIAASVSGTRPGTIALGITVPPANGIATLTNTGVVTYRPNTHFSGIDRLVVTVVVSFTDNSSPALLLGTVPINITINPLPILPPPNHPPAPAAPVISTPQNTPGTSQVTPNDPDVGQTLTFSVTTPAHGTASVNTTGLVTYMPAPGFTGSDSLVVTVTDNGTPPLSGTVTISVTVDILPVAVADWYVVVQNGTLVVNAPGVLGNDGDVDAGQTLAVDPSSLIAVPTPTGSGHGTINSLRADGSFSYTPNAGFTGTDTFSYQATDGILPGTPVTVTITVVDAAVTPVAANDAYNTTMGVALVVAAAQGVLANDNHVVGHALVALVEHSPAHGTLVLDPDGVFSYTPDPAFAGVDSFTYRVHDETANSDSNVAMVTLAVQAAGASPTAVNDAYSTDQGVALDVAAAQGVLANDTGTGLTAALVSGPLYGAVVLQTDGAFSYTPAVGFAGRDSFIYRAQDGSRATSNLAVVTLAVRGTTSVAVSASANPTVFGEAVTFTATMTPATATGTVQFQVDGAALGGPVAVVVGSATSAATAALTVAGHTVTALYSGDSAVVGSTGTLAQTVTPAATTTTLAPVTPEPSVVGQAYTVSYSVAVTVPGAGTPTGTVTVNDGTGNGCTASVAAGSCALTSTTVGARTLTATYAGDSNFLGSAGTQAHTVNKAATTTTITSVTPEPSVVGQAYTVSYSVTVPASAGIPTGTVTVTDSSGNGCTASIVAGSCALTSTTAGAKTLMATYGGDSNFLGSAGTQVHTVTPAATTTGIFSLTPEPSVVGESYTVIVQVTVPAPVVIPTGTVTVADGTGATCTASLGSGFTGSCALTSTTAGVKTLTLTYAGDSNFLGSTGTGVHTVNKAATTTTITSVTPEPSVVGQAYTVSYSVAVTAPGAGTPTGTVTVADGTGATCTTSGAAGSCVLTSTTAGAKALTATYTGDSNFQGSTGTQAHTVNLADTKLFGATGGGANPGTFYSIDPATGTATQIGVISPSSPPPSASGMAFNVRGTLYAVLNTNSCTPTSPTPPRLLTIDPSTGVGTDIGSIALPNNSPFTGCFTVTDLSFRHGDNVLYAYITGTNVNGQPMQSLATLDVTTGNVTLLVLVTDLNGQLLAGSGNGIAFAPDDSLWHADNAALHLLNPQNGQVISTLALQFPSVSICPTPSINAMDFEPGTDRLFGSLDCGSVQGVPNTQYLVTIDITTGGVSLLGQTVSGLDALAWFVVGTTFTVSTTDDLDLGSCDTNHCSLREAINAANAHFGPDTINFSISGTIMPGSALPSITDAVFIDGLAGDTIVTLDGSNAGLVPAGLTITAGGSKVQGLSIDNFHGVGILLKDKGGNVIEGNSIVGNGFDLSGQPLVNGGAGVCIASGTGNAILSNQILGNGTLGIDLGCNGVTPNDLGDADTGPNNLQNFPGVTATQVVFGDCTFPCPITAITATFNSVPLTNFRIEFFASSGCIEPNREGEQFLASTAVTTDSNGNITDGNGNIIPFSVSVSGSFTGQYITATATNLSTNDTSEFSGCFLVP